MVAKPLPRTRRHHARPKRLDDIPVSRPEPPINPRARGCTVTGHNVSGQHHAAAAGLHRYVGELNTIGVRNVPA